MSQENQFFEFIKHFKKNKSAVLGFFIALMLVAFALFSPVIATHLPNVQDLQARLIPPFWNEGGSMKHLLGTDDFGRDIFSRIVYGARISIMVGTISVSISLFFGLLMGVFAGYYGKWVDAVIMRLVDMMLSVPAILLAIVIVSILGDRKSTRLNSSH